MLLCVVGFSYAYFSLEIDGTGKNIAMSAGDLKLEYIDETELKLVDAVPGDFISKVITVKNIGTREANYSLYLSNLVNTIDNFELHISLECKSYINYGESYQEEKGTCDRIYRAVPFFATATNTYLKKNISIDENITQEYTITLKFDNKSYPQDSNINKIFNGNIGIEEFQKSELSDCTYDGDLVQGSEYVNGQYTYRYKSTGLYSSSGLKWNSSNVDGWGVQLTDKTSTDPVTSKLCNTINGKPITGMSYAFDSSKATTIDVSTFDTSNVITMRNMFADTQATSISGLELFDTSKVTDMYSMFLHAKATALDVSTFDTSKVTNMSYMFKSAGKLNTIYVSDKFVIDNVTSSDNMFGDASSLVGGAGTQYNSSYVDKTYAIIDGGTSSPGYFTLKS